MSLGCEAEVGPEYVGDVTLELRGHVVVPPDDAQDLVPALVFQSSEIDGSGVGHQLADIIDGKLEGVFPSDFKLRVAGPPPLPPGLDFNLGYVALVPREHPASLELPLNDGRLDPDSDEDSFTEHRQLCTGSGKCVERDYACVAQDCEIIDSVGSPEQLQGQATFGESESVCSLGTCYTAEEMCSDDVSCYRRSLRCDVSAPRAELYDMSRVATCTKTAESGDPSVLELQDYARIVSNLFVVYSAVDHPAGAEPFGLQDVKAGYHLVKFAQVDSDQSFIDYANCRHDARDAAVAAQNEAHGTHDSYYSYKLDYSELSKRVARLTQDSCPWLQIVSDPAAERVDLNLGSQLPSF
ncbi:MAG TPA: hypothetical protein VER04_08315 [Polyangiaceae bacterium]|nr:hypothetical protein [Polyangiaceae bacterium]